MKSDPGLYSRIYGILFVCFRAFLEQVLYDTMAEIRQSGTFQCLTEAVCKEKDDKRNTEAIIRKYFGTVLLLMLY